MTFNSRLISMRMRSRRKNYAPANLHFFNLILFSYAKQILLELIVLFGMRKKDDFVLGHEKINTKRSYQFVIEI